MTEFFAVDFTVSQWEQCHNWPQVRTRARCHISHLCDSQVALVPYCVPQCPILVTNWQVLTRIERFVAAVKAVWPCAALATRDRFLLHSIENLTVMRHGGVRT